MTEIPPASEDLFFDEAVRSYVNMNRRFVHREWLADSLKEKLSEAGYPFILLTAEPGAGKSAFVAQLAHDHPDWPRYFIRRDQRTALGDVSAKSLLLRIGYQLAARQPVLFSREQLHLSIEQRIGDIAGRGEAIGAEVKRLIASPFYQKVLHIEQHVRSNRGLVVGLRVDELVVDARQLNEVDLLHLALIDPARALQRTDPNQHIVVLVDALDEVRYHSTAENILAWLTNCPKLPGNVRFVLTSRPDEALKLFCAKQSSYLTKLAINEDDPRVENDTRQFVRSLVGEPEIALAISQTKGGASAFAQNVLKKAHGNMGYLDAIARGIDQALTRAETQTLKALLTLDELPADLEGLYAFFLHQIKEAVSRERIELEDPVTGETYDKPAWPTVYSPILGVLAVATEPLSLELIRQLADIRAECQWVIHALERLLQFLETTNDRYRFYHTSVAEFLTGPSADPGREFASLYQDPEKWHSRISDHYWKYSGNWSKCDDYGLNSLAIHLASGKQTDRLLALLDMEWMRARYEASGYSYQGFVADIDTAQIHLEAQGTLSFARLVRLVSMRQVVRDLVTNFEDEDLETLVFLGRQQEALAHVRLRRTTVEQCRGLLKIHKGMLEGGQGNALLLDEALRLAQAIPDASDRAALLLEISEIRAKEGDSTSKAIFEEARKSISMIQDPQRRWYKLRDAIDCLVRCEFYADAERRLAQLRSDVEVVSSTNARGRSLGGYSVLSDATSSLVRGLSECGQEERAEALIAELEDKGAVVTCLAALSLSCRKKGDARSQKHAEEAYEIALQYPYDKDRSFAAAATSLRLCGDSKADTAFNRAIEAARSHPESSDRAVALSRLGVEYYVADPGRAHSVFEEAITVAAEDEFKKGQLRALEAIVLGLSSVGEYERALHSAELVTDPGARARILSELAMKPSRIGVDHRAALDMAVAAFVLINDDSDKIAVGRSLALSLAKAKDPRGSLIFRTVQELARSVMSGYFDWALAQWAPVFAKTGHIDSAKSIARRIRGSPAQSQALEDSIYAIAGSENVEGIKALAFELKNHYGSVKLLTKFALGLAVKGHSDAHMVFERATTMARSLTESCARAEATSHIARRLHELKDPEAPQLFDEAYREALDHDNRGELFSRDRLANTALNFALTGRHDEAKMIIRSCEIDGPGENLLREVVGALARHGRFRDAWRYANLIKSEDSFPFYSQRDWALFDIAAVLIQVRRFNTAERLIEKIQLPDAQVRALCLLGRTLHPVAPERANAVLQKATDVARSIRNSLYSTDAQVLSQLCLDLYKVNAEDAPSVLDETITAINRWPLDRDIMLEGLAMGLCDLGQSDAARTVARFISDIEWRDSALEHVADSLAKAGRFVEAKTELGYISSKESRERALYSLATSYAEAGCFEDAEMVSSQIDNPEVNAYLYCNMGLIATEKLSDRASEFFERMGNLLSKVDSQEILIELANTLAFAGKLQEAIIIVSRCELDRYLQVLGEWAPLFDSEGNSESVQIMKEAASIASWARQNWREVYQLL